MSSLPTIVETANSDYEFTDQEGALSNQYGDAYYTQAVKLASEEWQSATSDTSPRLDEGSASLNLDARLKTGHMGNRSSKQAPSQDFDGSDYASAQRSSPGGSGTSSIEESNTDATSAMQQSFRDGQSEREETLVAPSDEFDLAAPVDGNYLHSLEALSDFLIAGDHLKNIFADPSSLLDFTTFLSSCRPKSIAMLMYYLDATEALKAVNYALTIAESLEKIPGHDFTAVSTETTMNAELEDKVEKAFNVLVKEELPLFVTQLYVQTVKSSMVRRIMGPSAPATKDDPEGMLEVFCLTDPSRPDNPIVFASQAFHEMTRYSMGYVIGRNCRFLQGPKTNQASIDRIRTAMEEGRDHCDLILNYRRDGSPFLNLLMLAQLRDVTGKIRYTLGAQIDVSNVVPDSTDMDNVISRRAPQIGFVGATAASENANQKDESRDSKEMLDLQGRESQARRAQMIQEHPDADARSIDGEWRRPVALLRGLSFDSLTDNGSGGWVNSRLSGFYQNYLLIRPYPSLRVLFASQSFRVPGIVQTPIIDKIGGSPEVREGLTQALAQGRSVTAKVRWVTKPGDRGRNRWIAFTPLVGSHEQIGVWVAILVDEESETEMRQAPPVKFRALAPQKPAPGVRKRSSVAPGSNRSPGTTVPDTPVPRSKESPPASINPSATSLEPEIDEGYETLEVRLRKKRERNAARLLEKASVPIKPTYKSLSPYAFMNNDAA